MKALIMDCGTTNLRVTLLDEALQPVDMIKRAGGVRYTAINGRNGQLKEIIKDSMDTLLSRNGLTAADVSRCVAYGMITSEMGLLEIPHVAAPASAEDLRAAMKEQVFSEIAPFPIAFIPGVSNFSGPIDMETFGMMDMMRGEETEAIGLYEALKIEGSALFVLPGSHNKMVAVGKGGKILGCMTSISGELLDALTHHTILADAVDHEFLKDGEYDSAMACEGAWECMNSGLGHAAFAGRILRKLGKKTPAEVRSYLLGAALTLDVQAMNAFVPRNADEEANAIQVYYNQGLALGVAPDHVHDEQKPVIYVAGKDPVQQAMLDVLEALGHEDAQPVPRELSAHMGILGAVRIAF